MKLKKHFAIALLASLISIAHADQKSVELMENFALDASPTLREAVTYYFKDGRIPTTEKEVCSINWAASKIDELSRNLNLGDPDLAYKNGHLFAGMASACALEVSKHDDVGILGNMSYWAKFVGIGLHVGNVNQMSGTLINAREIDRAIAYLKYAQSTGTGNNQHLIDQLSKIKSKLRR